MARNTSRPRNDRNRRLFLKTVAGALTGGMWAMADGQGATPPISLVLYQSGDIWEEVPPQNGAAKELKDLGLIAKGVPRE